MEDILLSQLQYSALLKRLDEINVDVTSIKLKSDPEGYYINNHDLMKLLQISKSTAQRWRNDGRLHYIKYQKKLYYRTDVIRNSFKVRPHQPIEVEYPPPGEIGDEAFMVPVECENCPLFRILNA